MLTFFWAIVVQGKITHPRVDLRFTIFDVRCAIFRLGHEGHPKTGGDCFTCLGPSGQLRQDFDDLEMLEPVGLLCS